MEKRKTYIAIILFLAILIVSSAIFFSYPSKQNQINNTSPCVSDEDCVKVQTSCCPCSSSGQEICVPKSEQESYTNQLKNCSDRMLCAAVYTCSQTICGCVKGKCAEKVE